jgi:hypothetical protein
VKLCLILFYIVVDDDAVKVIACDFSIIQNVVLFSTTVALLK